MLVRLFLTGLLCVLLVIPAHAKPWNVVDLGRLHKEEHCMLVAARTFKSLRAEYGAGRLRASDWVTFADDVAGNHDAMISCGYSGLTGARATLVVHSNAKHVDAHFITRRISILFEEHAQKVTQAWRDSYN